MRRVILVAACLLLHCAASMGAEGAGAGASDAQTAAPAAGASGPVIVPPAIISRPQIFRPDELREAMVYVRFMVSSEGVPVEIEVQEDRGFHTEPFRKEALKFVTAMRFRPATRDGVPVVYGPLTQPLKFGLGLARAEQGVTGEFRRELNKVAKLMKNGDFPGAHFHAEWMLREKVKFGYEFAVLQAQLAQTLVNVGKYDEALKAVRLATERNTSDVVGFRLGEPPPSNDADRYLLPKDLVISLLEMRMGLLAQRGQVLGALKTYNELAGLEKPKAEDASKLLADKLVSLLQSGKALAFGGEVTKEFWSHELYHPRFTTRNVQGAFDLVHLHCRGQFGEYEYEAEKLWTVPPGWEDCIVEFYGEPGAKLEVVEMPASSNAANALAGSNSADL